MPVINRPEAEYTAQNQFGLREPGITHPDNPSYFRLKDNGNIEIMLDKGLGIIMDKVSRSITLIADDVKIITNDKNGLKWNDLSFNYKATSYSEPAFLRLGPDDFKSMYSGFEDFLKEE
jgi:hypothetical protein